MSLTDAAGWLVDGVDTGFAVFFVVGFPVFIFLLVFSAREAGN